MLLPEAMVYSLAALPVGLVLLNPALYGASAQAIVGAVLGPVDLDGFRVLELVAPIAAAAGAWLTSRLCRRHLPARFGLLAEILALAVVGAAVLSAAVLSS